MYCPRCETVTLDERERHGIVIDACPTCRGVWLDRGELERIVARSGDHEPTGRAERSLGRDARGRSDGDRRGGGRIDDEGVRGRRRDDDDDDDEPRGGGFFGALRNLFD